MAVPAVWRLINLLAFIEPKQHAKAHRRDACAPLPKSKSKLLLVLRRVSKTDASAHVSLHALGADLTMHMVEVVRK
jgi:hypothetical protein